MSKRILTFLLTAALICMAGGCGDSSSSDSSSQAETSSQQTEKAFDDDDMDIEGEDTDTDEDNEALEENAQDTDGLSDTEYDFSLGTARELDGNIAVVTILANTPQYKWDKDHLDGNEVLEAYGNCLSVGTKYLEDECKKYGKNPNFIYNWDDNPELFYMTEFNIDIQDDDSPRDEVYTFLEDLPTTEILKSVNAEQVIYVFCYNTDMDNTVTSYTDFVTYKNEYDHPYENISMLMGLEGNYETPAALAHEILHTFGAPDLYLAENYGITQEYVDYVKEERLNDIMRDCYDPETGESVYDGINNEITDITAYYAGLTDHSDTVDEWGFEPSQHLY